MANSTVKKATVKNPTAGDEFPPGMPPFQIQFRHIPSSPALEHVIQGKVEALWRVCPEIMNCRVLVERAGGHHEHGNLFHVRIIASVPRAKALVVSHHHPRHLELKHAQAAVQDAFDTMHRVAEEYRGKLHGEIQHPHEPLRGEISALFPDKDSGRIRTPEGREVYFHRNSLQIGELEDMQPGMRVEFEEEMGEEGPQAIYVLRR